MSDEKILMGSVPDQPAGKSVKSITFSVTEDCNLICKYCYLTGKNSKNRMSFDTAKKVVDYILSERELFNEDAVTWEFIGGEPFLEIDLIDKITEYIKEKTQQLNHPWAGDYALNISTNGLLYGTEKVQDYIKKNMGHISVGISLDGNKIKHDLQRIKPDGSGSYDDIIKNVGLWMEQFPKQSTKATFAREDLIHVKDSVISLWDNGVKDVMANVIFEDVWQEGDDLLFEKQLIELADYTIENKLWKDHNIRFFDYKMGFPLIDHEKFVNFCGTGRMLAVDTNGRFFPCIRFLDFSINNKKGLCIGDYKIGIDTDKLRPFHNLSLRSQSTKECIDCEVASGCAWCTGCNYDCADTDTLFQRMTFLCKIQKANVRACNYFWDKLREVTKKDTLRDIHKKERFKIFENKKNDPAKYLFIITSDNITPHCNYRITNKSDKIMDEKTIGKGIEFAEKQGLTPIFLGKLNYDNTQDKINIVGSSEQTIKDGDIIIYDNKVENKKSGENCILLLSKVNITKLNKFIKELYPENKRINIILEDVKKWSAKDLDDYKNQLELLTDFIVETFQKELPVEINVLTDILDLSSMCNCDAGVDSYALAPNGKFYICPAFYFNNPDDSIGDLSSGLNIKNDYLFDINRAECCMICDAYHCKRCKYDNKRYTGEIHIPSKNQCVTSHIERNASALLQQKLINKKFINPSNRIIDIDYLDPIELIKKGKRKTI